MENALALSGPAAVLLLILVGSWELIRKKRRKQSGTPLAETYINEFTAVFYGSKRMQLEHRDSVAILREEDAQGAPPSAVDLAKGTVVVPVSWTERSANPAEQGKSGSS
ncbi:DUF6191 domain-containing protein [Kibdelosporangium philippinense]|uniref:DUF6191 domain-containing protein n=1 Tax=Kibdelosporangium philippinense TaxID=211113 RepID=A0ABS8ZRU8_9PSEU|nr:DUF6191 domain-containing protein [Kibdelosporangium philippinense]MCE7010430.1 DUF6191 domain-containing protein [Kibdelosporangium philippinense]